jgi:hypothetical protein
MVDRQDIAILSPCTGTCQPDPIGLAPRPTGLSFAHRPTLAETRPVAAIVRLGRAGVNGFLPLETRVHKSFAAAPAKAGRQGERTSGAGLGDQLFAGGPEPAGDSNRPAVCPSTQVLTPGGRRL